MIISDHPREGLLVLVSYHSLGQRCQILTAGGERVSVCRVVKAGWGWLQIEVADSTL